MAKIDNRPKEKMQLTIEFADNGIILRNPELEDEVTLALTKETTSPVVVVVLRAEARLFLPPPPDILEYLDNAMGVVQSVALPGCAIFDTDCTTFPRPVQSIRSFILGRVASSGRTAQNSDIQPPGRRPFLGTETTRWSTRPRSSSWRTMFMTWRR